MKPGSGTRPGVRPGPWRAARPELVVAVVAVAACAISAYAVAGGPAAVLVVVVSSAAALGVLSLLLPTERRRAGVAGSAGKPAPTENVVHQLLAYEKGFDRRHVIDGCLSGWARARSRARPGRPALGASRRQLVRPTDVARSIFCANTRDAELWPWVDPASRAAGDADGPGIPPKILARLVQRLEQL